MALSTASLQNSMLAILVLLAPALVAGEAVSVLTDVPSAHVRVAAEAAHADMPSFALPEVVVTASRLAPLSLPEVVVTAERLAPLSLPEVLVVADRLALDARLVQADTLLADTLRVGQFEIAARATTRGGTGLRGSGETVQP